MSINNYDDTVYKVTFCRNYLLTKNMFMMFDIIYKYIMYNICRKYLLIKNTFLEFDMIYKNICMDSMCTCSYAVQADVKNYSSSHNYV